MKFLALVIVAAVYLPSGYAAELYDCDYQDATPCKVSGPLSYVKSLFADKDSECEVELVEGEFPLAIYCDSKSYYADDVDRVCSAKFKPIGDGYYEAAVDQSPYGSSICWRD